MPCQTCNHTFQLVVDDSIKKVFWCPNCGTLKEDYKVRDHEEISVPTLVDHLSREFSIVVVDDDDSNLQLMIDSMSSVLSDRSFKYQISGFESADAFIERSSHEGVDLFITDFNMPGRNGLEFVRYLRKEGSQAKIVVMSGGNLFPSEVREAGGNLFISKPVSLERCKGIVRLLES